MRVKNCPLQGPGNLGAQALQLRLHPSPRHRAQADSGQENPALAMPTQTLPFFAEKEKPTKMESPQSPPSAAGLLDLRETVNHSHWAHMDVADEISDNDVEPASKLDLVPSRASTVVWPERARTR